MLSRSSGFLLLLMFAQAAFGYGMAAQPMPEWVRTTHFLLAFLVMALAVLVHLAVRRLPWGGRRETTLYALVVPFLFFVFLQLVTGLALHGWLPGASPDLRSSHIGLGLLVTLLVVLIHVLAIGPSLALSARREYLASRERLERDRESNERIE